MTHLLTKFLLAAVIRGILYCKTGKHRVTLGWTEYLKRVAPAGITGSLDIGLSNWSFAFITISLYTMTKTTAVVFIFFFSVVFRLEKPRWSLIVVVLFIAVGLFMFTFESTQFNALGFTLVLLASFISGMRWTLAQMVLQRSEMGLGNPLDMMYHIQPWMMLSLLPLSTAFEGVYLATSEHGFAFQDGYVLLRNLLLLLFGASLAFMLELSEFLVVSHASGITLSIAGILKEIITILLAAFINGDQMSALNVFGLVICLAGITLHVVLKALNDEHDKSKEVKCSLSPDHQDLLNSEEVDSDSSEDYVLYSNSRKR